MLSSDSGLFVVSVPQLREMCVQNILLFCCIFLLSGPKSCLEFVFQCLNLQGELLRDGFDFIDFEVHLVGVPGVEFVHLGSVIFSNLFLMRFLLLEEVLKSLDFFPELVMLNIVIIL